MGPQYTMADLFYYGGMIAGMGLGYKTAERLGFQHQLVKLLAGVALGVLIGFCLERMYTGGLAAEDQDDDDDDELERDEPPPGASAGEADRGGER